MTNMEKANFRRVPEGVTKCCYTCENCTEILCGLTYVCKHFENAQLNIKLSIDPEIYVCGVWSRR
jgi:hypothetical protein